MTDAYLYRVRARATGWGGAPGLHTFYFGAGEGEVGADADIADACSSRVRAAFDGAKTIWPTLGTIETLADVDVINAVTGTLAVTFATTPGASVVGTGAASYGPQAAMACVQLHTAGIVAGRRVRGRSFLGPLVPGNDADGTPNSTIVSTALAFGNALIDPDAEDPQLAVWSRPRTALAGSVHVVTSVSVKDSWAILRSRRA